MGTWIFIQGQKILKECVRQAVCVLYLKHFTLSALTFTHYLTWRIHEQSLQTASCHTELQQPLQSFFHHVKNVKPPDSLDQQINKQSVIQV